MRRRARPREWSRPGWGRTGGLPSLVRPGSPRLTAGDEPGGGEEVYGALGLAFRGEVGQDLTDHAAELEAVPRKGHCDGGLGMVGVGRDHEMLVGGVRVHAGLGVQELAVEGGNVLCHVAPDELDLVVVDLAVYGLGVGGLAVGPEECDLDPTPRPVVGGYGVERVAVFGLPDKDGEPVREERLDAPYRVEPEQDLARNLQWKSELREQLRRPRAGGDDQPLRLVNIRRRLDPHPRSRRLPGEDLLPEPEVGA